MPESNYRYYTKSDVEILQQIMIYKEFGFELDEIKQMIQTDKLLKIETFQAHLIKLNEEKLRISKLIQNIDKTIQAMKGERTMTDTEKFEGFKEKLIDENDKQYKEEVIKKWGKDAYETSNKAFKNMSKETYMHFESLTKDIISTLLSAFKQGNDPKSETALKAAKMHKEWITLAWGRYDQQIHLNLVDMYLADERFKAYYDKHQDGLAQLLRDAVHALLKQ